MEASVVRSLQPIVHVLATSNDATSAALRTAIPLARGSGASLVVMVPQIVPYAIALDAPVDRSMPAQRYRKLVESLGGQARIEVCLCRRREDVTRMLPAHAVVVMGGEASRLWPDADSRLARRLTKLGHRVVFVPTPSEPDRGGGAALAWALFVVGS